MKNRLKTLMMLTLVAGSLSFVSCRETKEDEPAPPMQNEMREGEMMDETTMDEDAILRDEVNAEFENKEIASVYQHYINIKKALVQTDAAMAQERAKEMVAELEGSSAVKGDIASAAKNISASNDVNAQREAFSKLTRAVEFELEGAITSGEIYKQFCPMAFEGKGDYWFSNTQEIRNPYYGDKMLKCGRVEETLN